MIRDCIQCSFPVDAATDIFCSGCGASVVHLETSQDAIALFASHGTLATGSKAEIVVRNASDTPRLVSARSQHGCVRVTLDGSEGSTRLMPDEEVPLVVELLDDEFVGSSNAVVDEVLLSGELGPLMRPVRVTAAPAPSLRLSHPNLGAGSHRQRTEVSLPPEGASVELVVPAGDPSESLNSPVLRQRVDVFPVGQLSLYLARAPVCLTDSDEPCRWVSVDPPLGGQITSSSPLEFVIDAVRALDRTTRAECRVEIDLRGLGTRSFDLSIESARDPVVRIKPVNPCVDQSALPRYAEGPARLEYELENPGTEPIVLLGCSAPSLDAATDGRLSITGWSRFDLLNPGETRLLTFEFVPAEVSPERLMARSSESVTLLQLGFEIEIETAWNRDGADRYRNRLDAQLVDFRMPNYVDFVGIDFGTSNTCLGIVVDVNRTQAALDLQDGDPRHAFCCLDEQIRLVDLDPSDTLGFELPSAVRVNVHPAEVGAPPRDIVVGELAYRDMLMRGYAVRTAWMMKRALRDDSFGRALLDNQDRMRTYTWSSLVESYLRRALRMLLELPNGGGWPREIVYSYPATWDRFPKVREALERAIHNALLGVQGDARVSAGLSEPEALAVYYANKLAEADGLPKAARKLDVCIFDCGGGTTDVAVLRLNGEVLRAPTGEQTVWSTSEHERVVRALERGGEDLTMEFARIVRDTMVRGREARSEEDGERAGLGQKLRAKMAQKQQVDAAELGGAADIPELPATLLELIGRADLDRAQQTRLEDIVAQARKLKVEHYTKRADSHSIPGSKAPVAEADLRRAADEFAAGLIADLLAPSVDHAHAQFGRPDATVIVLCGNSTRHPAFAEQLAAFAEARVRRDGPGTWSIAKPDDQRKANLVKGLLMHALHSTQYLADGRANPLADSLEVLPVRSGRVDADPQEAGERRGVLVKLVSRGRTEEQWLDLGAQQFELWSHPVKTASADVLLSVSAEASDAPTPLFHDASGRGTRLDEQLDAAPRASVRRIRFVVQRNGDVLRLGWVADMHTCDEAPGGWLFDAGVLALAAATRT